MFIIPSMLASLSVPTAEKHPYSLMSTPHVISQKMSGTSFLPDTGLDIQAIEYHFYLIRHDNRVCALSFV